MKLVILGGTFNPPHNGHIAMADLVRRSCGYDHVVLIPSFQPAHKSHCRRSYSRTASSYDSSCRSRN